MVGQHNRTFANLCMPANLLHSTPELELVDWLLRKERSLQENAHTVRHCLCTQDMQQLKSLFGQDLVCRKLTLFFE